MLRIDVLTLFPGMVEGYASESILGRASSAGHLDLRVHDLRLATSDVHRTVDDSPFGGGAGMVLMPEPVFAAVEAVEPPRPLILMGPAGRRFDQSVAAELAALDGFSLLCGRYEGVDERIRTGLCDDEISLGDFVLAGGELAALAIIEWTAGGGWFTYAGLVAAVIFLSVTLLIPVVSRAVGPAWAALIPVFLAAIVALGLYAG
jgi:tRNA (guanine37-N1)-methyltransferase